MYTEEEAKKLWCPEANPYVGHGNFFNRYGNSDRQCIASGCMMWRWVKLPDGSKAYRTIKRAEKCNDCGGSGSKDKGMTPCETCDGDGMSGGIFADVGYCGKGGKP